MKFLRPLFLLTTFFLVSCHDDIDDFIDPADSIEINEFVWRAMNNMYLYKEDIPQLADDYFGTQKLQDFLRGFGNPEDLFYDGLVSSQDQFSFLVDDYIALEKSFSGISLSSGMEYGLVRLSSDSDRVLGYVRYVLPGTSAKSAGLVRGDIFYSIDGENLTLDNYSALLAREQMELGLAIVQDQVLSPSGQSVQLKKAEHSENPVHLVKTIETPSSKVGYILYNGFTHTYDHKLNEAFAGLKSDGISDLIIDLRYNSGGAVESAVDLASMITGQFEGEVFARQQWNQTYQEYFEKEDPERLINRFNTKIGNGDAINSLELSRVYVLTTKSTASASELLINGLSPYIEVIQIGENTTGKFQASVTLYDSPDFGRRGASINHQYAIQPLIYKSLNAQGKTDYLDGLTPAIYQVEDILNLGALGDPDEALLALALSHIQGIQLKMKRSTGQTFETIDESGSKELLYQQMYIPSITSD